MRQERHDIFRRYIRLNLRKDAFCLEDLPSDPMFPWQSVEAVSWLPKSMRSYSIPSTTRLVDLKAYKEGKIFGVDAASLAAVQCLDVQRTHDVLDLCCAPGSKLFAIADLTDQDVIGVDISSTRLGVCRKLANEHRVRNCFLIEVSSDEEKILVLLRLMGFVLILGIRVHIKFMLNREQNAEEEKTGLLLRQQIDYCRICLIEY